MLGIFNNIPISFIENTILKAQTDQQNDITDIKLKNRYNTIKKFSMIKKQTIGFNDRFTSNVEQKMKVVIWQI